MWKKQLSHCCLTDLKQSFFIGLWLSDHFHNDHQVLFWLKVIGLFLYCTKFQIIFLIYFMKYSLLLFTFYSWRHWVLGLDFGHKSRAVTRNVTVSKTVPQNVVWYESYTVVDISSFVDYKVQRFTAILSYGRSRNLL